MDLETNHWSLIWEDYPRLSKWFKVLQNKIGRGRIPNMEDTFNSPAVAEKKGLRSRVEPQKSRQCQLTVNKQINLVAPT